MLLAAIEAFIDHNQCPNLCIQSEIDISDDTGKRELVSSI